MRTPDGVSVGLFSGLSARHRYAKYRVSLQANILTVRGCLLVKNAFQSKLGYTKLCHLRRTAGSMSGLLCLRLLLVHSLSQSFIAFLR